MLAEQAAQGTYTVLCDACRLNPGIRLGTWARYCAYEALFANWR